MRCAPATTPTIRAGTSSATAGASTSWTRQTSRRTPTTTASVAMSGGPPVSWSGYSAWCASTTTTPPSSSGRSATRAGMGPTTPPVSAGCAALMGIGRSTTKGRCAPSGAKAPIPSRACTVDGGSPTSSVRCTPPSTSSRSGTATAIPPIPGPSSCASTAMPWATPTGASATTGGPSSSHGDCREASSGTGSTKASPSMRRANPPEGEEKKPTTPQKEGRRGATAGTSVTPQRTTTSVSMGSCGRTAPPNP